MIYGSDRGRQDGSWDRDDDRRERDDDHSRGRAIPRRSPSGYPYPDRYPDGRGGYPYQSVPFDNGHKDGYDKGREDAGDNDRYDPARHSRYRSGDHGYDRRYGSKEEYRNVYREGFRAGYDEGYRDTDVYRSDRRSGIRLPWPF